MHFPIPRAPPVTTATFPLKPFIVTLRIIFTVQPRVIGEFGGNNELPVQDITCTGNSVFTPVDPAVLV